MNQMPGSRYFEGLVLASMNSHNEVGDSKEDHLIKRLVVFAQEEKHHKGHYDLVAVVEVEIISIEADEDHGWVEPGVEVYRCPFPTGRQMRKSLLRTMKANPKFSSA